MKLPIPPLGQKDSRWASKRLGSSSVTIGGYGCLLTCHAMMLNYYGHETTPDVLNEIYKTKKVYHDTNLIDFWKAADVFTDIQAEEFYNCLTKPCDLEKIRKKLNEKKPVIAWVDNINNDDRPDHFVIIIGEVNDDFLIIDPYTGETYFFTGKYGDPARFIYGLRIYSGTPQETENQQDTISDLESKVSSCNQALAEKSLEVNTVRADLEAQERDNKDLVEQVGTARGERDKAITEKDYYVAKVEKLDGEKQDLEKAVKVLKDEKKELSEALKTSQAQIMAGMSFAEALRIVIAKIFGKGA